MKNVLFPHLQERQNTFGVASHTEETRIERDICTPMFIAALFIIARTWKQPRCPSGINVLKKKETIYFSSPWLSPGTCLALDNGVLTTMRQVEAWKNTCSLTCLLLSWDYAWASLLEEEGHIEESCAVLCCGCYTALQ